MNRISVLLILALCVSHTLIAQNVSDLPANSAPFNFTGYSSMTFDNRYEGIKGSYTFLEDFSLGTVQLKKNKFTNILINYDAYSDALLAKSEKMKDTVELRKDLVESFVLKNGAGEEFIFVKKKLNTGPAFLWEIVRDSITLYCRIGKKIKKAEIGGAYNISEVRYDEFINTNQYYVDKGSGELILIQGTKKGLLKTFPEIESDLSAYLKKNKVDFDDYAQVKAVAMYINSLKK